MRPARRLGVRTPAVVVASYVLLVGAHVVGNPPFAGPDEESHYVRAVAIPHVGLVGEPVPDFRSSDLSPVQLRVVRQAVRRVSLPAALDPTGWECFTRRPRTSAGCLHDLTSGSGKRTGEVADGGRMTTLTTVVGTYQPTFYVLLGYAAAFGTHPGAAALLARVVNAAVALPLIAAAIFALWRPRRGALPMLGPLVALTPMALHVTALVNPSGPEIAAGFALAAGLLRLARDDDPSRGVWALVGVSAAALALSRSISPAWLLLHLTVFVLWIGPRRAARLCRRAPLRASAVGTAAIAAVALNLAFEAAYGLRVGIDMTPVGLSLLTGVRYTWEALIRHAVGVFGYLETPLPHGAYLVWRALAVGLVALALAVGTTRQRVMLAVVTLAVVAAPVLLEAGILRHHGFHIQGRHFLPVLVAAPLMAGEILSDRWERLPQPLWHTATGVVVAVVAVVQLVAWYANARRAAVGVLGPWRFLAHAEWAPPGGWIPVVLLVVAGAALLPVAWLAAVRRSAPLPGPAHGSSARATVP